MSAKTLSIVIPVYNEKDSLRELYFEIKTALESKTYEIIFVDDASTDGSDMIIEALADSDKRVKGIFFTRNAGQTSALQAGFQAATGELIVTLDADLQNNPADIPMLIEKMEQDNVDVISGWRKNRKDNFLTRTIPSTAANKIISIMTGVRLHDYGCTLKVYKSSFVKKIKLFGEMHRFLPAIVSWQGAKIGECPVNHRPRKFGQTKYGLMRTFKVILDLFTVKFIGQYQTKPIYFFGSFGILSIFASFIFIAILIYMKIADNVSMITSPLLHLSAMLFVLGVQFIMLGLLAEILVRVHFQIQNQETFSIKKKINID